MAFLNAFITQTFTYATIYTLTSLGIVISGRTGIFNIAGEGIMLASASAGFVVAHFTGSWAMGFLAGALLGAGLGLILIFLHESFQISQFILGISLIILGTGLSDLIYNAAIGVTLVPPKAPSIPVINLPVISKIPLIMGVFHQDIIVYFTYLAVAFCYWFYYRTKIGLEIRSIGENPKAADVSGINVLRIRYLTTIIGSALMGVSGAYLPIAITGTYSTGMAAGRGFMAIGIAIFASWRPDRALLGGILFAGIEVISFALQRMHTGIPYQFFLMLPFISVLVVMVIFRKQVEFPAALGKPYSRE
ncbi:MAG TPA: ABC transporter permease [Firmicutes bacterium]|nr:ABC transporter permease [Bacillota bacterium]